MFTFFRFKVMAVRIIFTTLFAAHFLHLPISSFYPANYSVCSYFYILLYIFHLCHPSLDVIYISQILIAFLNSASTLRLYHILNYCYADETTQYYVSQIVQKGFIPKRTIFLYGLDLAKQKPGLIAIFLS